MKLEGLHNICRPSSNFDEDYIFLDLGSYGYINL